MNYFRCGGGRSTHTATKIDVAKTPLATFESNVSGLYIPEILAYIQATQSGTGDPSPSNPRAINGVDSLYVTRTGVNLWDEQWELGGLSSAAGEPTSNNDRIRSKNFIPVRPNTSYYYLTPKRFGVRYYDKNKNYIGEERGAVSVENRAETTPYDVYYMKFVCTNTTTYGNDISINYPSTFTTYEQFKGDPYIKFFDGLMKGTYGFVNLGELSWTYESGNQVFTSRLTDVALAGNAKGTSCACTKYRSTYGDSWTGWANFPDMSISSGGNYTTVKNVIIKDSNYSDATAFKASLKDVYLIYELASATTPTITTAQLNMLQSAFGTEGTSAYIMLGGTYYGGYVNVTTGVLTVTYKAVECDGSEDEDWTMYATGKFYAPVIPVSEAANSTDYISNLYLFDGNGSTTSAQATTDKRFYGQRAYGRFWVYDSDYTDLTAFKAALSNQPLQIMYPLYAPQTYQLTPAQLEQLLGQNNVFCSSGDVAVKYWKID